MSGAISVWSCQRWRAVRCGPLRTVLGSLGSGWSQRELSGSPVMGGDSETKGGDGGEKFGTKRKRTWSRTQESHPKAFESTGTGTMSVSARLSYTFYPRLHLSYIRRMLYIYCLTGRLPLFPAVQPWQSHPTSTSPLQIGAPSLLWSSEYCGGVNLHTLGTILLERASGWGIWTQPQWLHYSSVAWPTESLKQLSPDCHQPSPVCLDRHRASEREKREGKRAKHTDMTACPRHKHFDLEKKNENQTRKSQ